MNTSKLFFLMVFVSSVSFGSYEAKAESVKLPVITRPAVLQEGINQGLTDQQIAVLLPWAKDSKFYLSDLLNTVEGLGTHDKLDRLSSGIASAVGESAPKNSELLMRYILNRGLVINDILTKEMDENAVGSMDVRLRVLKSSIELAVKYYEKDRQRMEVKGSNAFVSFGLEYYEFLSDLNKSIFDASAQYTIQRTALEWLQWDLYRDLNNTAYAAQIVKINNALKTFPLKKENDVSYLAELRLMKKIASQLDVKETSVRLEKEKQDELKRLEVAERERLREEEEKRRENELRLKRQAGRTENEQQLMQLALEKLKSSRETIRKEGAISLSTLIGADVTFALFDHLMTESRVDVLVAVGTILSNRVGNVVWNYEYEDQAELERKLLALIDAGHAINGWKRRQVIASVSSGFHSFEAYRILQKWLDAENDSDVIRALKRSMKSIENGLK